MADNNMDRTEQATPYRLQKAREEGQVAKSADVVSVIVFITAIVFLYWRDVKKFFDGMSHKDADGFTYKTQINLTVATKWTGNSVYLGYKDWPSDRAFADFNGNIWFDTKDAGGLRSPGLAPHEFAHTVLGLDDAYKQIQIPAISLVDIGLQTVGRTILWVLLMGTSRAPI